MSRLRSQLRRGLTLVEMVISIVLVGVMLVAALNTVGAAKLSQRKTADRRCGTLLAQQLMSEILRESYADPELGQAIFEAGGGGKAMFRGGGGAPLMAPLGPEAGEADGTRAMFDDVDDYLDWSASPPQYKDGTEISDHQGWRRSVEVVWVAPSDLTHPIGSDFGTKLITVAVEYDDVPVAELTAVKTVGLPPPEDDDALKVLLVVTDDSSPTAQESARQTLMESWGFSVTLIAASASQSDLDNAVADADVAYVSEEIDAGELGTKLRYAAVAVVNEDEELVVEFGFASDTRSASDFELYVEDNTHYITSDFSTGWLGTFSSVQPLYTLKGFAPPQLDILIYTWAGGVNLYPSLVLLEEGWALYGGGTAAARRVQMPWGADSFDISSLAPDGQTIMKRAIEWAASMEEE